MSEKCLEKLDQLILEKHLLKHPFYLEWSQGLLPLEILKDYAKQYYHHVKAFPTYLSALHARTENSEVRKVLLQNLVEEEGGSPNHPDLWKNFALSLGVAEKELQEHQPNCEIKHLIETFRTECALDEGLAMLYAYESQIPSICVSKIDGLKKHYGMKDPKGWHYFSVHIEADKEHAFQERTLLSTHIKNEEGVIEAANKVLDALWNFLSGYKIMCA